ncbi:hypothetical protein VTK56DRAFT_6781 [Thermocarpiscus australiensis]
MAAPTVHGGVNGQYEGTIFGGIKFWVAQRVPSRGSLLDAIKDNGGKTVLLEKYADVLIADHARKDAPAGSVSWKYITDSVDKGELVNIDDYRIAHANVPRPVASTKPTKGTKVPFSKEDDDILVRWVHHRARAGESTSGNKIYQELAEKYPNHTWQSWRDRWVKRLSLLYEEGSEVPPQTQPPPRSWLVRESGVAPTSTAPSMGSTSRAAPGQARRPSAVPGRVRFTEEDDRILREYVNLRVQQGEKAKGNRIYQELEEEYPHHSYQSWRDRWVRHLSQREPESSTESTEPDGIRTGTRSKWPVREQSPPRATPASSVGGQNAAPSASDQRNTRMQELELKRQRIQATRTIQRVWRGYRVRRDLDRLRNRITAVQAIARGFLTRRILDRICEVEATGELDDTAPLPSVEVEDSRGIGHRSGQEDSVRPQSDAGRLSPASPRGVEPQSPGQRKSPEFDRKQFWVYFNQYAELNSLSPLPWVQIGRHTRDLWDVWRCVTKEPPQNRDWEAIAERLGLDWVAEPDVVVQVKTAFQEHLLGFELALQEFNNRDQGEAEEGTEEEGEEGDEESSETGDEDEVEEGDAEGSEGTGEGGDEEEIEEGDEQGSGEHEGGASGDHDEEEVGEKISQTQESETAPLENPDLYGSSPPVVGLKRRLEQIGNSSATSYLGSVNKRRRYDPDGEIPETPHTRIEKAGRGGGSPSTAAVAQETPSRRPTVRPPQPRQLVEPETQDFQFVQRHPQQEKKTLEPETQNFEFPPQLAELEDNDELVSPSQQLRSEDLAATPRPGPSSRNAVGMTSSADRPRPTVELEDAASDSSDEFESVSELVPRNSTSRKSALDISIQGADRRTRALPASWSKGKQPAPTAIGSTLRPSKPTVMRVTSSSTVVHRSSHASLHRSKQSPNEPSRTSRPSITSATHHDLGQSRRRSSTSTPTPTAAANSKNPTNTTIRSKIPIPSPTPIVEHFVSRGYAPRVVVRAVKATILKAANTGLVVDRLAKGQDIPENIRGVWTEDDDRRVRSIGSHLDKSGGALPARDGDLKWERWFWRLAEKHGAEAVLERREFLRVWDRI